MEKYTIVKEDIEYKFKCKKDDKIEEYKLYPKNSFPYRGIPVESISLINPSLIENVIKKKIKRKLDFYLKYLIEVVDNDDTGESHREALNELEKFKSMIEYKYRKFLNDRYVNLVNKKISLLEKQIEAKIVNIDIKEQETRHRRR